MALPKNKMADKPKLTSFWPKMPEKVPFFTSTNKTKEAGTIHTHFKLALVGFYPKKPPFSPFILFI